jgi:hypothetical protein
MQSLRVEIHAINNKSYLDSMVFGICIKLMSLWGSHKENAKIAVPYWKNEWPHSLNKHNKKRFVSYYLYRNNKTLMKHIYFLKSARLFRLHFTKAV